MDLNLIRTFVITCEAGGVSAAAERLKLPKSTVSRRLTRLEDDMQTRLLERSATGLVLTPEGRRLFEDVRPSIHALEPLDRNVRSAAPMQGHFIVDTPRVFAEGVLNPILMAWLGAHPEHEAEVLHGDRFTAAAPNRADISIHVGTASTLPADTTPLMTAEARLYAAPGLFRDATAPQAPGDLEVWPFLTMCSVAGVPERLNIEADKGRVTSVAVRTRLASNEQSTMVAAACAGLGIVQLPAFTGERLVGEGRLVRVLPGHRTDRFVVSLALPRGSRNLAARAFAAHLAAELAVGRKPHSETASISS